MFAVHDLQDDAGRLVGDAKAAINGADIQSGVGRVVDDAKKTIDDADIGNDAARMINDTKTTLRHANLPNADNLLNEATSLTASTLPTVGREVNLLHLPLQQKTLPQKLIIALLSKTLGPHASLGWATHWIIRIEGSCFEIRRFGQKPYRRLEACKWDEGRDGDVMQVVKSGWTVFDDKAVEGVGTSLLNKRSKLPFNLSTINSRTFVTRVANDICPPQLRWEKFLSAPVSLDYSHMTARYFSLIAIPIVRFYKSWRGCDRRILDEFEQIAGIWSITILPLAVQQTVVLLIAAAAEVEVCMNNPTASKWMTRVVGAMISSVTTFGLAASRPLMIVAWPTFPLPLKSDDGTWGLKWRPDPAMAMQAASDSATQFLGKGEEMLKGHNALVDKYAKVPDFGEKKAAPELVTVVLGVLIAAAYWLMRLVRFVLGVYGAAPEWMVALLGGGKGGASIEGRMQSGIPALDLNRGLNSMSSAIGLNTGMQDVGSAINVDKNLQNGVSSALDIGQDMRDRAGSAINLDKSMGTLASPAVDMNRGVRDATAAINMDKYMGNVSNPTVKLDQNLQDAKLGIGLDGDLKVTLDENIPHISNSATDLNEGMKDTLSAINPNQDLKDATPSINLDKNIPDIAHPAVSLDQDVKDASSRISLAQGMRDARSALDLNQGMKDAVPAVDLDKNIHDATSAVPLDKNMQDVSNPAASLSESMQDATSAINANQALKRGTTATNLDPDLEGATSAINAPQGLKNVTSAIIPDKTVHDATSSTSLDENIPNMPTSAITSDRKNTPDMPTAALNPDKTTKDTTAAAALVANQNKRKTPHSTINLEKNIGEVSSLMGLNSLGMGKKKT